MVIMDNKMRYNKAKLLDKTLSALIVVMSNGEIEKQALLTLIDEICGKESNQITEILLKHDPKLFKIAPSFGWDTKDVFTYTDFALNFIDDGGFTNSYRLKRSSKVKAYISSLKNNPWIVTIISGLVLAYIIMKLGW